MHRTTVITVGMLLSMIHANVATAALHPEVPGAPQKQPIAIVNATIHPVSGADLQGATLLFDKGKIVAVGRNLKLPTGVKTIDASGKHVYPGLFDAITNMGLVEVNSISASVNDREIGEINPNVRAEVAVNPDSEIIPVTRTNGILLALTAPSGRLFSGRSAVVQLDGWTWEDMTLKSEVGQHVRWPSISPVSNWTAAPGAGEKPKPAVSDLKQLESAFKSARRYHAARRAAGDKHRADLRWEAMLPVLEGKVPMIVAADDLQQIQSAVAFASRQRVRLIIAGGYDADRCVPLLKKHDVPIIIAGVYRLPVRRDDNYDAAYTLAARLHAAGLTYCISSGGRFGASNVRNLPYHAATAVAYGLPEAEAIKAITLYPARILGVADRVGSLETGKDATLIITSGNPLETTTQVEAAFIQGRAVALNDRHQRLYRKYEQKYRQKAAAK